MSIWSKAAQIFRPGMPSDANDREERGYTIATPEGVERPRKCLEWQVRLHDTVDGELSKIYNGLAETNQNSVTFLALDSAVRAAVGMSFGRGVTPGRLIKDALNDFNSLVAGQKPDSAVTFRLGQLRTAEGLMTEMQAGMPSRFPCHPFEEGFTPLDYAESFGKTRQVLEAALLTKHTPSLRLGG